jgi:hypothetical protein
MVINLTALNQKGHLSADSDMDGIPDDEDLNPLNPRSNGKILDGLCHLIGEQKCNQALSCDPSKSVGFGLNQCDQIYLQDYSQDVVNGIDSDEDFILDFVEIIKKTDPLSDEMMDPTPFQDGFTFQQILTKGLDTQNNNKIYQTSINDQMDFSFALVKNNSCLPDQEQVQLKLNHLPFVQTKKYVDISSLKFNLSHDEGENIFLVFYKLESIGGNATGDKFYVQLYKAKSQNQGAKIINQSDFLLLGN